MAQVGPEIHMDSIPRHVLDLISSLLYFVSFETLVFVTTQRVDFLSRVER